MISDTNHRRKYKQNKKNLYKPEKAAWPLSDILELNFFIPSKSDFP